MAEAANRRTTLSRSRVIASAAINTVIDAGISLSPDDISEGSDANFTGLIEKCRAENLVLDGRGKTVYLSAPLPAFSANTGAYDWKNLKIVCLAGGQSVSAIRIMPDYPTQITHLIADAMGGANSFSVADIANLNIGQRIMLISNDDMYAANGEIYNKVSTRVNIKRIDGNVITIFGVLPFDFPLIASTKIFPAEKKVTVNWENVTIERGGVGHICADIFNANIKTFNIHVENAFQLGVGFDECTFSGEHGGINVTFKDILFSYPVGLFGCDTPKVNSINGDGARHLFSFGRGSGFDVGGSPWRPQGEGGYISQGHGTRMTNSLADSHPGHRGGSVSNISGELNTDSSYYPNTVEVGQITDGVTMEGTGQWSFQNISLNGAHSPFAVQFYGDPEGTQIPTTINIDTLNSTGLSEGAAALNVQNRDSARKGNLIVNVGHITASGGGLVNITSNIAGDVGGSVDVNIGSVSGYAKGASGIYAEAGGHAGLAGVGKVRLNIGFVNVVCSSENGNHMGIVGYGGNYTAENLGDCGCEIFIGNGSIERLSNSGVVGLVLARAYDTRIILGSTVELISGVGVGAASQMSGLGSMKRLLLGDV